MAESVLVATEADHVYEILKRRIINLEYSPSDVLNEVVIAKEFDLSRSAVRKTFEKLKNKKLLNIIPRFGAQVAPIDFRYMKSIFEILPELEAFAAKLAASKISAEQITELENIVARIKGLDITEDYKQIIMEDEKFHEITFESCGNNCLIEILRELHMHTVRLWFYVQEDVTQIDLFFQTLQDIVAALKAQDAEKAEQSTRDHIHIFVSLIKKELL